VSGSGSGTGGPPPTEPVDCANLQFDAELASPQPKVVATLKKGTILSVELDAAGGRNRIIARAPGGQIAGALISGRMAELLRCLQAGESFVAEVTRVDGGDVRVRVRHS
jgi:hypothetical protein